MSIFFVPLLAFPEPFSATLVELRQSEIDSTKLSVRVKIEITNRSDENLAVCTRTVEVLLVSTSTGKDVLLEDTQATDKQPVPKAEDFTIFTSKSTRSITLLFTFPIAQRKLIKRNQLAMIFRGGLCPYSNNGMPTTIKSPVAYRFIDGDHRIDLSAR